MCNQHKLIKEKQREISYIFVFKDEDGGENGIRPETISKRWSHAQRKAPCLPSSAQCQTQAHAGTIATGINITITIVILFAAPVYVLIVDLLKSHLQVRFNKLII